MDGLGWLGELGAIPDGMPEAFEELHVFPKRILAHALGSRAGDETRIHIGLLAVTAENVT